MAEGLEEWQGGKVKAIALIILALTLSGCATAPPWERAEIGCLQYANAACINAVQEGYQSGMVTCTLPGTTQRHAVTWVIVDGKTLYYDAAWGIYRTRLGTVHSTCDGPSLGSYAILPLRR